MTPKQFVALYGAVILVVMVVLAVIPDGWIAEHGFIDAAWKYFDLVAEDPLLLGSAIDFLALALFLLVALLAQLPPERRWGPRTWLFLPVYLFAPSVGIVLYLLYVHPRSTLFGRPLQET